MEIDRDEYNSLKISEAILEQLENNGVDNWQHYGCMCYDLDEDECIFCADNTKEYLNLKEED